MEAAAGLRGQARHGSMMQALYRPAWHAICSTQLFQVLLNFERVALDRHGVGYHTGVIPTKVGIHWSRSQALNQPRDGYAVDPDFRRDDGLGTV
jgi:hypothetical protein